MTGRTALACVLFGVLASAQEEGVARFEQQIKAEQYAAVEPALEAYTTAHPDSWRALYQLGYVDFRLHKIYPSIVALSQSLSRHEPFAEAHKILALDLNIIGHKDLAEKELLRAIALDGHSAESCYELGRIYYDEGSYLKAVEYLERSRTLDPARVKVHHNLGLAYAAVGKDAQAVSEFEEGLRLNAAQSKPSAWPLIDYASYCNLRSKFEKSRDLLLRAVQIDPGVDRAYEELSKAYRALGETDLAIQSLQRAAAMNPRKPEYHYSLSRLYSQANKPADARQELALFRSLNH